MDMPHNKLMQLGTAIGGTIGTALNIEPVLTHITFARTLDTIFYAVVGALAGLFATYFGKWALDKIFKK